MDLAQGHSRFSQDSLVMAAPAEVEKTQIHSGGMQRPGYVNSLLFGPALSQAGSDHSQAQLSRLSVHGSVERMVKGVSQQGSGRSGQRIRHGKPKHQVVTWITHGHTRYGQRQNE